MTDASDEEYRILLTFRHALRRFLRWSEREAAREGLTGQQHQLLLCVRGNAAATPPSISEIAEQLMVRVHSAVGLVNRTEAMGLVARHPDAADQRVVRVELTAAGSQVLARLTIAHLAELERVAAMLGVTEDFLAGLSRQFMAGTDAASTLAAGVSPASP